MYNCKTKMYPDGVQTRLYNYLVNEGIDRDKDRDFYKNKILTPFGLGEEVYSFTALKEREEEKKKRSEDVSRKRTLQKIYDYARANVWDYFITLTFNPVKVDRTDYNDCTKKLSKWINNVKQIYCKDMKYLFVPELHKDGKSYHFHGLIADCDGLELVDSGYKTDGGDIIYNIGKYRLGWTTATEVKNNEAVTKYITKYITKELCTVTKGKKRYWISRNLDKPIVTTDIYDFNDMQILKDELYADYQYAKILGYDIAGKKCQMNIFEHSLNENRKKAYDELIQEGEVYE